MGLSVSHSVWHGSYHRFQDWRNAVAEAAGVELEHRNGYRLPVLGFQATPEQREGRWAMKPDDPITMLLAHSDSTGTIEPEDGPAIADRLDELMDLIDPEWREKTDDFAAGLRDAARCNDPVVFK